MIVDTILNIVNKFIPDADKQAEVRKALQDAETIQNLAQKDIILAEMNAESWLTRNWRPMMLMSFGFIIVGQWCMTDLFPYIKTVMGWNIWVPKANKLDPMYIDLIQSLAGISVGARTLEKMMTTWKK